MRFQKEKKFFRLTSKKKIQDIAHFAPRIERSARSATALPSWNLKSWTRAIIKAMKTLILWHDFVIRLKTENSNENSQIIPYN